MFTKRFFLSFFLLFSYIILNSQDYKGTNPKSKISFDPVRKAQEEITIHHILWTSVCYSAARLTYTVGFTAARYGGRYLLLESPNLGIDLVNGNACSLVSSFTEDGLLELIKTMISTPDKVCESLAQSLIKEGLKDYKISYNISQHYLNTGKLNAPDAIEFLLHRWGPMKLGIARTLYIESKEKYSIDAKMETMITKEVLAKYESVYKQKLDINKNLPILDAAFFIKEIMDILKSKKVGLGNYTPYQNFEKYIETINLQELAELKEIQMNQNSVNLIVTLKTHQDDEETIFIGDNRFDISFKSELRNSEFWTEMFLQFNRKEVDLYDAPHGPGLNQIALWSNLQEVSFNEIISNRLGYLPFKFTGKVISQQENEKTIQITISATNDINKYEINEFIGNYVGMAAGDLVHVFFKGKEGEEQDFTYSDPECIYLIINKDQLAGKPLRVTYVKGSEYNNVINMNIAFKKILNVYNGNESSQDWWNEIKKDSRTEERYQRIANNFVQFLFNNYGNTY